MPKQLFIHVGAGKTGSSAIQEFLLLNEKRLAAQNLVIPKFGLTVSNKFYAHHPLAGGTSGNPLDPFELWRDISKLNNDRLLVSSEVFHSRISRKNGDQFFERILSSFPDRVVKVIFYIRQQDQWLQSAYEEWVKTGLLTSGQTIDQFVSSYRNNLPDQLFAFSRIFGKENMIIKPYEKEQFFGGDIFRDFFEIFGIKINEKFIFPSKNPNPRLSRDSLEFKRIFNTICQNKSDRRTALKILQDLKTYSRIVDSASSSIHHDHSLLTQQQRFAINEKHKKQYYEIAKDFLNREDGRLFMNEISKSESEDSEIDFQEDMTRISAFLFLSIYKNFEAVKRKNDELSRRLETIEANLY